MLRPHYQIHTTAANGTQFEKNDVLDPIKNFLERHNIPSEIVQNVSFSGNAIYVKLQKGSAKQYGEEIDSVFKPLSTARYSYALIKSSDMISCWVPFLEDVVEANNLSQYCLGEKAIEPVELQPQRNSAVAVGKDCQADLINNFGINSVKRERTPPPPAYEAETKSDDEATDLPKNSMR